MVGIEQIGVGEIIGRLPQLVPWDRSELSCQTIDLLIICAGFEDRAVAIVNAISGVKVLHQVTIHYPTNAEDNARASDAIALISASRRSAIVYDKSSFFAEMNRILEEYSDKEMRIVVDVSAMASYVTSRVLSALWNKCSRASIRMYYAEARDYHPTREDWEVFFAGVERPDDNLCIAERYEDTYFQSREVDDTYECDAFPGSNEGPLATQFIAIPSFSLYRVKSMTTFVSSRYNVAQPDIQWFLGSPPDKERNGWRFDAMAKLYNVRSGGVAVDTRDYRDVLRKLDESWGDALKNERHVVVGGMGSKMQNVGVFLFLMMHPECGLLHCEPREFIAKRYTDGIGPQWCLNLGQIAVIQGLIRSRGQLLFHWD